MSIGERARDELQRLRRLARLVGRTRSLAGLEEALTPGAQWTWGGPMNGQEGRRALVRWMARQVDFTYAIETGTWHGGTTGFLADVLGCDVWTVEADVAAYRFTWRLLTRREDVHLALGDSRSFLAEQAERDDTDDGPVFFYLDAHWDTEDLPLWDELRLVTSRWREPVILIDDFEVPGDPDYRYDDYGPGRALVVSALDGLLPEGTEVLFPALPGAEETGKQRGCAVIVPASLADRFRGPMLRSA